VTIPTGASFHVGLAFLLGMVGQVLARHLRIPGIVVLLGLGVAAGPDGLDLLRPATLGGGLSSLVTFAVAIILFEGGMALDLRSVWRQGRAIRGLVTVGALVTAAGAGLAAHLLLGWEGPPAVLFGTLMIVTGPTVIQPILRRIRVSPRVATVLEGEAIFGDALGATVAVVALELALAPSGESLGHGWIGLLERFGVGVCLGLAAGGAIALAVRYEKVVAAEVRNALSFAILVGAYQLGEAVVGESGIIVAIAAGLVVGNLPGTKARGLHAFKEELTTLLLGLLFVLLAADVRLTEIRALGWAGVAVVASLMVVVRPVNVALATLGTDLTWRERGFLSWLAPRGIVAAAVASYFAEVLDAEGVGGGAALRALVFLVIAATVTIQGISGGLVARLLGVARGPRSGWAILGANGLGIALAERLGRDETILVDSSADHTAFARSRGLRAVTANALDESTLLHPEVESRKGFVATTPNEEINFIFARRAREILRVSDLWVALRRHHQGIRPEMLEEIRAHVLYGGPHQLEVWALRFERGLVALEWWRPGEEVDEIPGLESEETISTLLPVALRRGDDVVPFSSDVTPKEGDAVAFALFTEREDEAREALTGSGWSAAPPDGGNETDAT